MLVLVVLAEVIRKFNLLAMDAALNKAEAETKYFAENVHNGDSNMGNIKAQKKMSDKFEAESTCVDGICTILAPHTKPLPNYTSELVPLCLYSISGGKRCQQQ